MVSHPIISKSDQQLIFHNNSTLSYKQIAKTTFNKTAIRREIYLLILVMMG